MEATVTYSTDMKSAELIAAAKAAGVRYAGRNKAELVEALNNPQPAASTNSTHEKHPLCQELVTLLGQVDVASATVTRGVKTPVTSPLLTEREKEILDVFFATGFNIKQTAKKVTEQGKNITHTGVWQRLYGINRENNAAKGILGKLREYVAAPNAPVANDEDVAI